MSPGHPEPSLFLFLGFFSPPAFLLFIKGSPVIALALERRTEISDIPPLVAHEYGHYLVSIVLGLKGVWAPDQAAERMVSEGLAVHFSRKVYPELPDHQLYFLSRSRLQECRRLADDLMAVGGGEVGDGERLAEFFLRYPAYPRGCRTYLAYRLLERERAGKRMEGDFEGLIRSMFG
jgi:hypothetical protein